MTEQSGILLPPFDPSLMPSGIRALPLDLRGYPIPVFVSRDVDPPDLRIADEAVRRNLYRNNQCWVCGLPLSVVRVFIGGPCAVLNRVFGDWASHPECAGWSMRACPILNGIAQRRSGRDYPEGTANPEPYSLPHTAAETGVVGAYYTSRPARVHKGLYLAGPPRYVHWWSRGRRVSDQEARPHIERARKFLAEERAKAIQPRQVQSGVWEF